MEFQCKNVGVSAGKFCIIPKNQWPVSNLRVRKTTFLTKKNHQHKRGQNVGDRPAVSAFPQTVANSPYSEQAPFAISPSLFHLQAGESVDVGVSA